MLTLKLKHSIAELDNLCLLKPAKTRTEQKQTHVTVSMCYHKFGLDLLSKLTGCFTPSQPLRLSQHTGLIQEEEENRNTSSNFTFPI